METNIFKDAKFRDEFVTKDGRIVVFWKNVDQGIICFGDKTMIGYKDGNPEMPMTHDDNDIIVSRYQEPIDEENLNKLAEDCRKIAISAPEHLFNKNPNAKPWIFGYDKTLIYEEGFKDGYHKAINKKSNYNC